MRELRQDLIKVLVVPGDAVAEAAEAGPVHALEAAVDMRAAFRPHMPLTQATPAAEGGEGRGPDGMEVRPSAPPGPQEDEDEDEELIRMQADDQWVSKWCMWGRQGIWDWPSQSSMLEVQGAGPLGWQQ